MHVYILLLCLIELASCKSPQNSSIVSSEHELHGRTLIWADEFDYEGVPDSSKWVYDLGDSCDLPAGCGWGNKELQHYTSNPKNVVVNDGKLQIQLLKESMGQSSYTSARIKTKGKGDWKYGRFEIRAKLPKGKGVWPAIWMLPSENAYGGWPKSGEIDIMENVGYDPDVIVSSIHTSKYNHIIGTHQNGKFPIMDNGSVFHNYILEWNEENLSFYVDEERIFTFENSQKGSEYWPFDQSFHLIINLAFGGNWGGLKGIDPDSLPATLEIDYVRVYQ